MKYNQSQNSFETCDIDEDIKQSLYLLLNTRRGERLMRPNYGCDLSQFAFESVNYELLSLIENEILSAIKTCEPRVRNVKISIDSSDKENISTETLIVNIEYTVKENAHEQYLSVNIG